MARTISRERTEHGNKTLYVATSDTDIWRQATDYCYEHRISLSSFVADALRWYLARLTK